MLLLPLLLSSLLPAAATSPVGATRGDVDLTKVLSGRDDIEFGRALASAGFGDLAERLCFTIQKNFSGDANKVLECEALLGDIHLDQAYRETDANKRREKLEHVLDEKGRFVNAHGDVPVAEGVIERMPELYRSLGDTLIGLIEQATDETAKGELRREAARVFEEAESFLGKRVGALRAGWERAEEAAKTEGITLKEEDPHPLREAADLAGTRFVVAITGLARTKYYHATTLAQDDPERLKLLQWVANTYDDLELDFPEKLAIFDGFIFRGLALDGMGNTDGAIKSFDAAIRVRDFFPPEKNGVRAIPEEVADVISNAIHQKMLLLKKKGQGDEAIKVATDFFTTTLDAYKANRAIAILSELADAYDSVGDQKGLERTANKLIEIDPRGVGGQHGRQLLGGGGGGGANKLGARNVLALANDSAGKGEIDKSMEQCRQVLALARGLSKEQERDLGADACILLGALYSKNELYEEAVVAWDTVMERYPEGANAPDALWRSINGYIKLSAKQKRAIWDKRYRERVDQLVSKFPKHPNVGRVTLLEGQRREDEGDFLGAAQIYEKIQKGNPAFEEAEFRSGSAYARCARKLATDGKVADAKKWSVKAEEVLRRTTTDILESIKKNLDAEGTARLTYIDFSARVALAGVLLTESVNKPAEVPALLEDAEKLFPGDGAKLRDIWDLRFRSYQAQGKLDLALAQLEAALKDPKTAVGLDRVAVNAGRAFDTRAIETLRDKPESAEVDALFKKSFDWYMRGLAPQLEGRAVVDAGALEGIAQRLFIFGLHLNRVPAEVQSFADWDGKVVAPEPWTQAIRLYTTVLPYTNNARTLLELAKVQAWLGKWKDAAPSYIKYFDREKYVDLGKKEIDKTQLMERPDMLFTLLEWGIIEQNAAKGDSDKTHLERADAIFFTISNSVNRDSKIWWQSKHLWLTLMFEQGDYAKEDIVLRGIERSSNKEDAKFGFKAKFEKLRQELDAKLPPKIFKPK